MLWLLATLSVLAISRGIAHGSKPSVNRLIALGLTGLLRSLPAPAHALAPSPKPRSTP